jgi:TorA maturation chaperone TorD
MKPQMIHLIESEFLDSHLLKWVPRISQDVKKATTNEFYLALASLLQGFVDTDPSTVIQAKETLPLG